MKKIAIYLIIYFSLIWSATCLIFVNTIQAESGKPVVVLTNIYIGESGVSHYADWVSVTFSKTMNGWSSVSS
jgi:hypothetical protein